MTSVLTFPNKDKYSCPICFEIMIESIQIESCGHNICKKCSYSCQNRDSIKCPLCRSNGAGFVDARMHRELDSEIIHCDCGTSITYKEINLHARNCSKQLWKCKQCLNTFPYSDISRHADLCPDFFTPCNLCQSFIRRKDLNTHQLNYCVKSPTCLKVVCQLCPVRNELPMMSFQNHYETVHVGRAQTKVIIPRPDYSFK